MEGNNSNNVIAIATLLTTVISCYLCRRRKQKTRRPRRWWTRQWILRRNQDRLGSINTLQNELRLEDKEAYKSFLRMIEPQFNYILRKIRPLIQKKDTVMRAAISPETRLALTLRFLATGESFQSMELSTRVPHNTLSVIVRETCQAIKTKLGPRFLKPPATRQEWEEVAKDFWNIWDFPNCLGAMDGKHVAWRAPEADGSIWRCYKGFDSMVLLAIVDAKKRFMMVDVGANGRQSDGGVYARSDISTAISKNSLNFPPPKPLPGRRRRMPHVFVADNAFPLRSNILVPYTFHGLTNSQLYYNKRVSRARNVVENAFGIMANRFRIFLTPIELKKKESVKLVIETCCILHNFLMQYGTRDYQDVNLAAPPLAGLEPLTAQRSLGARIRLEFLAFFQRQIN